MDGANDIKFWHYVVIMEYFICAKTFFKILINGRMRAANWMKAGCVALLPSVEVAMKHTHHLNPNLTTNI